MFLLGAAEIRSAYQHFMVGEPIIRADFDVYLDDYRLIYVKEGCRAEDFEARVFLHVFPMDKADLPDSRRRSTTLISSRQKSFILGRAMRCGA